MLGWRERRPCAVSRRTFRCLSFAEVSFGETAILSPLLGVLADLSHIPFGLSGNGAGGAHEKPSRTSRAAVACRARHCREPTRAPPGRVCVSGPAGPPRRDDDEKAVGTANERHQAGELIQTEFRNDRGSGGARPFLEPFQGSRVQRLRRHRLSGDGSAIGLPEHHEKRYRAVRPHAGGNLYHAAVSASCLRLLVICVSSLGDDQCFAGFGLRAFSTSSALSSSVSPASSARSGLAARVFRTATSRLHAPSCS